VSKRRLCSLAASVVIAVLAVAQPALAQGSRDASPVPKPKTSAAATADTGGFPFTGLDVTLLVGGGALLLGSGVAFGRLRARRGTAT
jgi:hypothetical protein